MQTIHKLHKQSNQNPHFFEPLHRQFKLVKHPRTAPLLVALRVLINQPHLVHRQYYEQVAYADKAHLLSHL